ncbi:MAG: isoaspartyl peptidase/L-asparaginase [Sphingobacteriales bacterium]|nr:MAG: isoaspartyl peptidase/L-asparaginase [Sphingobacteriales bacterium]
MPKFSLAIHGGAGTILPTHLTPEMEAEYKAGLLAALKKGYDMLSNGSAALDVVEASLKVLEDNPLFNAGKGSVFNHSGTHEMDASIMCGKTLRAGAVSCVKFVRNPIELARKVMEQSPHVFLCGDGAEEFAHEQKLAFESKDYFYTEQRYQQWIDIRDTEKVQLDHTENTKFGTAGVVAYDQHGDIAAATSTGGMTNKRYNRIGDTPVIGSGTYANNKTCAISCTGHGEFFLRAVAAYDVSCLMEYGGLTLQQACEKVVLDKLLNMGGEGGLIGVDSQGNVALVFNSLGMYRGWQTEGAEPEVGIYQ